MQLFFFHLQESWADVWSAKGQKLCNRTRAEPLILHWAPFLTGEQVFDKVFFYVCEAIFIQLPLTVKLQQPVYNVLSVSPTPTAYYFFFQSYIYSQSNIVIVLFCIM